MLVVLEGCDGAGKTTVAKQLQAILPDAEIIHCTTSTPNNYGFFKDIIEASKNRNIIADRFCYGQFVYQDPNDRQLSDEILKTLEIRMIEAGARIIHVTAPVEDIKHRLTLRGEKTEVPVEEICDRYIDLFENTTLMKPYIWWTGGNV